MVYLLLFGLLFTNCDFIRGQTCSRCTIPPGQLNSALAKNVINVLIPWKELRTCADNCMYVTECLSINYDKQHNVCEWLKVSKDTTRMVHGLNGYVFLDMVEWKQVRQSDPCSDKPCKVGEQCVPNKYSYECIEFEPLCNGLYLTSLLLDEFKQVIKTSSPVNDSEPTDISLYSNGGIKIPSGTYEYLQVDLSKGPFVVKGIMLKGNPILKASVLRFWISTSDNCTNGFSYIREAGDFWPKNFTGNALDDDFNTPVITYLDERITGGCMRMYIKAYRYTLSFRMDLVGCPMK